MRGGAILTTISAATALKASAPAKTNPITLFRTIFTTLRALAMHVRGRRQTRDTSSGGYADTGKSCIQVHCFCLPAPQHDDSAQTGLSGWFGPKAALELKEAGRHDSKFRKVIDDADTTTCHSVVGSRRRGWVLRP
jgi:hypothetical protein